MSQQHALNRMEYLLHIYKMWADIAQPVQRLITGWKVRGSDTDGGEIFRTRPDQARGSVSQLYNRYRLIPGVKTAEACC